MSNLMLDQGAIISSCSSRQPALKSKENTLAELRQGAYKLACGSKLIKLMASSCRSFIEQVFELDRKLRIMEVVDDIGHKSWLIEEPLTGRRHIFKKQQEVLVWLDSDRS